MMKKIHVMLFDNDMQVSTTCQAMKDISKSLQMLAYMVKYDINHFQEYVTIIDPPDSPWPNRWS